MTKTLTSLLGMLLVASAASAEPMFLAKQYTRCTACHYSPTGGGLLTPYGRLLSHRELSTTRGSTTTDAAAADDASHGEQAFLFGALGDALGPVHLGVETRPSYLRIGFPGGHEGMDLLMNLDLVGAVQHHGWTAYGTVGREPPNSAVRHGRTDPDAAFISYEHWISYGTEERFRIRAGRFLPAYGVRFADHTMYTRRPLGLDRNDQVYGVEVSGAIGQSLVQVMVSPGKAEAILHDHSRRGFSAGGRWQFDLTPRATVVGSGLYRQATDVDPQSGTMGGALGIAPTPRLSIWTEADAVVEPNGARDRSWAVVNETSLEIYRGVWLKISPQLLRSGPGRAATVSRRLALAADLFPRTHWNINVAYDRDRTSDVSSSALVVQLHLFM
jgi:hypothetical protein